MVSPTRLLVGAGPPTIARPLRRSTHASAAGQLRSPATNLLLTVSAPTPSAGALSQSSKPLVTVGRDTNHFLVRVGSGLETTQQSLPHARCTIPHAAARTKSQTWMPTAKFQPPARGSCGPRPLPLSACSSPSRRWFPRSLTAPSHPSIQLMSRAYHYGYQDLELPHPVVRFIYPPSPMPFWLGGTLVFTLLSMINLRVACSPYLRIGPRFCELAFPF